MSKSLYLLPLVLMKSEKEEVFLAWNSRRMVSLISSNSN